MHVPVATHRSVRIAFVAVLVGFGWLGAWSGRIARAEPAPSPGNALHDATLRAVWFLDPDRGWAVGDRGVIWRTVDGGRQWQLQAGGVSCNLYDVFFADPRTGWIVGGWTHPYTRETTGVVLRTLDGGQTWVRVSGLMLPTLRRVRFFTPREGIAIGESSSLYPAGVFRTVDGGRSWNAMPPGSWSSVATGDFVDSQRGMIVSADGHLAAIVYGRSVASRMPSVGARRVRSLVLQDDSGWVVGDGGLVMRGRDYGAHWEVLQPWTASGATVPFDYRAVFCRGNACWIAGAPGSMVFYSPDRGEHWERFATGATTPIERLWFYDENRGWAVGALGMILGTRDGGRTWWKLRSGGDRTAMLALLRDADSTPWEMLGWYGANEGYLSAVVYLNRRDMETGSVADEFPESTLDEAVVAAGGTWAGQAWNFPIRQRGLLLSADSITDSWDRANDGFGRERLREYVVRQIRMWRPDVVVTEEASTDGKRPVDQEINQAVIAAVEEAADSTKYPELTAAGLPAWQVKKVFSSNAEGPTGIRLNTAQLAANLGMGVQDFVAHGRGLVQPHHVTAPDDWYFRILVNRIPQDIGFHALFSGLNLTGGGGARRAAGVPPSTNLEALSRLVQKRRNIEQLLAKRAAVGPDSGAWVAQVDDLTRGFAPSVAAAVLFQLASRYERDGQMELAADTLQRLVAMCPEQELADAAVIWLVRYYASGEAAWLERSRTGFQTEVVQAVGGDAPTSPRPGAPRQTVRQVAGTAGPAYSEEARARQGLEYAALAARSRPVLHARPEIRFPLAVMHRRVGNAREADSLLDQLAASALDTTWRDCAVTESWLRHGRGMPPKPVATCRKVSARPVLDGDLSDEIWMRTTPLELRSALFDDATWPTSVLLAYDDSFLYVGATIHRAPGERYVESTAARIRDPRQEDLDRLEILLDVDRDYSTYYRFSVDYRGWGADALMGNRQWDPQWYIARRETEKAWIIEMAIPFAQLVPHSPAAGSAWAMQMQRVAPRAGFQAWSHPAAIEAVPRGFGVLMFQP